MSGIHPARAGRRTTRRVRFGLPIAGWLSFAASPTFAAMALLTALGGNPSDICSSGQGAWLGGMIPMYLTMSAFHAGPWLALIDGRRGRRP